MSENKTKSFSLSSLDLEPYGVPLFNIMTHYPQSERWYGDLIKKDPDSWVKVNQFVNLTCLR